VGHNIRPAAYGTAQILGGGVHECCVRTLTESAKTSARVGKCIKRYLP
jgi:hypothetical protein